MLTTLRITCTRVSIQDTKFIFALSV